jgi:hypothetical protein
VLSGDRRRQGYGTAGDMRGSVGGSLNEGLQIHKVQANPAKYSFSVYTIRKSERKMMKMAEDTTPRYIDSQNARKIRVWGERTDHNSSGN